MYAVHIYISAYSASPKIPHEYDSKLIWSAGGNTMRWSIPYFLYPFCTGGCESLMRYSTAARPPTRAGAPRDYRNIGYFTAPRQSIQLVSVYSLPILYILDLYAVCTILYILSERFLPTTTNQQITIPVQSGQSQQRSAICRSIVYMYIHAVVFRLSRGNLIYPAILSLNFTCPAQYHNKLGLEKKG